MVQTNKTKDLFEVLKPSFGSVKQLCDRISNAALELAITPLAEPGDYTAIQDAIFVMVELKKAFESIEPQH